MVSPPAISVGQSPGGHNSPWRRFRSQPQWVQGAALVAIVLIVVGVAKVATASKKKAAAPAVATAAPPATTVPVASTGPTTTAQASIALTSPSPLVVAQGTLNTHWVYLQGAPNIATTCAHPGYQIGVTDASGATLALATIRLGSARRVQLSDGTTAVNCSDTYSVTVAQVPLYTFAVTLSSAPTKQRASQTVSLAALKLSGAPSLTATEG